ncbi:polysaccharide biosynthesis/export family protein [Methylobacterium sp. J-059]|uniref:polysaccharide biosynthesis/export family protein n=1 Tax=Methylobacterium sp. J-059 TaxID=2836643 RepID=UPI001FBB220C|nr:polysaccharide biosynthesis/export family protein [Methylobacterium sp. J-059]MCJ2038560.1 polysaccharide biosynthesis/export family protein [Methylobacterium sp. J-059]
MSALGLAAAIVSGGLTVCAHAEYLIQPGDTVEIAVAGLPDLKQRSVVNPDGAVAVPMTRPVKVAGLGLSAAQTLIKDQLSRKLYQQRMSDGRDSITAIGPDMVMVTIAEYRPVYVNGDVTKPGEQVFRPGMTVRQAVALAGGYEIMRFRMNNPFLESADLRNDYQVLWMQYVKLQAKIWRLKNQNAPRDKEQDAALDAQTQAPLPKAVLESLRANARTQLAVANERFIAESAFLTGAVKTADDQIAMLRARQVKDDENVQVDTADYNKLKEFSERGNLPMTRLSEARRLFLFSATQSLQTGVQLVNTIRERDDARRKVARLDETSRSEILAQTEQATVELGEVRSKLQSVSEKITYTGVIRSQLSRGGGATPAIRIVHAAANGGGTEAASEDTPVAPGDTVDVALHTEVPEITQ